MEIGSADGIQSTRVAREYSNGETKDTISNRVYLEQIRLEFIEIDTCL